MVGFGFEQQQPDTKKSFESDQQDDEQSVPEKIWEQHDQEVHDEQPVLGWSAREPEEEMGKLDKEMTPPIQEEDPETLDSHVEIFNAEPMEDAYVMKSEVKMDSKILRAWHSSFFHYIALWWYYP